MKNGNSKKIEKAKEKFLGGTEDSIETIVAYTAAVKKEYDSLGKELDKFKSFFKAIGEPGEVFYGDDFSIELMGRATSTMEPLDLRNLLEDLGRSPEFLGMVSVKVADARKKLGTVLFDKIAETTPNASITVKIGKKK